MLQFTADVVVHNMMSLQTEAVRGGESGADQHVNDLIVKLQLDNLAQVLKTLKYVM